MRLEAGDVVPDVVMRVWATHPRALDPMSSERKPTILVVHALTGDMVVGGDAGWWQGLVGPKNALDTDSYDVLCINNLGSCYGSTGPDTTGFPHANVTNTFGEEVRVPATITTWDQARAIARTLDALAINDVALVVGGSIGAMIALALVIMDPARYARVCTIAGASAASAWIIGWNHVARQCILSANDQDRDRALEIARQVAHMTYRAEPGLKERQGRAQARQDSDPLWHPENQYRVQTYLTYHGRKLRERFTTGAYLAQIGAMDHHDVDRFPGPPQAGESWPDRTHDTWGIARIRASCLAVGIDTDQLYAPRHMCDLATALRALGRTADYVEIASAHGHDAFLIEWPQMRETLRQALALPDGRVADLIAT